MNRVILMGRLTDDPKISEKDDKISARYNLAVDRYGDGADFPSCVAFGKSAEFVKNYLTKGTKILIEGRIQTGSYTKQDGTKVYTTDVVVDKHEFCEPKKGYVQPTTNDSEPLNVPDGIEESLPFK